MSARTWASVGLTLAFALACTGGEDTSAPPAPSCDLALATLPGRSFVLQKPKDVGDGFDLDVLARAQFFKDDAGALKVRYTVRSLASVYTYSCTPDDKLPDKKALCLSDNPDPVEFCRSLWANTGACSADQLAAVLGITTTPIPPALTDAVAKVDAEIKKLKPADLDKYKAGYDSPNNQLRGVLKVTVKATDTECRLTLEDHYQTMSQGKLREQENVVGSAHFVQSDKPYVFQDCTDMATLVATPEAGAHPKPGETQVDWTVGATANLVYVGDDLQKPDGDCTYSMDTWWDYEPRQTGVPIQPAGNKLDWSFPVAITDAGRHVAHMYRYKACKGAAPALAGVSCQVLKVE